MSTKLGGIIKGSIWSDVCDQIENRK